MCRLCILPEYAALKRGGWQGNRAVPDVVHLAPPIPEPNLKDIQMDFSKFDSRAAAETPGRLQLKDPVTGELLFADTDRKKPCIVLVVGTESRSAQAALRAVQKAKMAEGKTEADGTLESVQQALVEGAKPLIKGFENIARGDRAVTLDDLDWLLNLQMINGQQGEVSFVEQITGYATKRGNYLGNAVKP